MELGPSVVIASFYLLLVFVCFQKGKAGYAWVGVGGLLLIFTPLSALSLAAGGLALVGATRYAKPDSPWFRNRYGPNQQAEAVKRHPGISPPLEPDDVAEARLRDPQANTSSTDLGASTFTKDPPLGPTGSASSFSEWRVINRFLQRVADEGLISGATLNNLLDYLDRTERPSEALSPPFVTRPTPRKSSVTAPAEPPPPIPIATPEAPVTTPKSAPVPPQGPSAPREPSQVSVSFHAIWEGVASDVALHGFAYLGVVLTFVGVLGFLLFAFVDVPNETQPFVELFIALVFFGWAWMLRRQKAIRVADAMELIGGMVLPLILFAGLVDGAPFPPDFTDGGLVVALTVSSLLLAVLYAWISKRNPKSTLRFLVAPLLWLGAMTMGFVFKDNEVLVSDAITRLVSPQPAMASGAIGLTLLACRVRRSYRLSAPSVRSALVGVPVVYLLTLAISFGEDFALTWPIVLLGASTLVSVELLSKWYERTGWMSVARPVLLAGVLGPLVPSIGLGWSGLTVMVTYLGLAEFERRRESGVTPASLLTTTGAAVGLVMSLQEPMAALLSFTLVSIWTHLRRLDEQSHDSAQIFTAGAALAPAGVLFAFGQVFTMGAAWLVMAGVLTALSVTVRLLKNEDPFWAYWLLVANVVVGVGAAAYWFDAGTSDIRSAAALLFVAVSLGLGLRWPVGRIWLAATAAAGAIAVTLSTVGWSFESQQVLWAVVGLVVVVAATWWRRSPASHLAAIGHVITTLALLSLASGGDAVPVLGVWAFGWLVSAAGDEIGGDTLTKLLTRAAGNANGSVADRLETASRWVVPTLLVVSIPPALLTAANQWAEFMEHRSWSGVVMTTVGVIYALASRGDRLRETLRRTLGVGAIVAAVIGVSVAAPDPWPTIYAAAGVIAVAALLGRNLRQSWFVWFAWLMTVVMALLLADQAGVPGESLHLVSLVTGGAMLIGGLIFDDVRSGRRQLGEGLRTDWLAYPVLLGALVVPVSLGPVFVDGPEIYAWWAIGASVAYFAVAILMRVGAVTAPAYALAALGLTALSPRSLIDDPWLFVFLAAPLVGVSWLAERRQTDSNSGWLRWDLAPLAIAHGIAAVALAFALDDRGLSSTALVFGVLSVVIGLWRRQRIWGEVGNLMILLATWDLGYGWFTLALAATSVRGVISAALEKESARLSYQAIAVLSAGLAWPAFLVWSNAEPVDAANYSMVLFGVVAFIVAALNRWGVVRRDTLYWWGGLAMVGTVTTALITLAPNGPGIEGPWFGIGLVLLGGGLELGSDPRDMFLKVASVATMGVAWLTMFVGLELTAPESYDYTALVFGGLALLSSILGRLKAIEASDAIRWGALGVAGVVIAALFSGDPQGGVLFDGLEFAIGMTMVAVAFEVGWKLTNYLFRYLAIVGAATAWAVLGIGVGWDTTTTMISTAVVFGLLALAVPESVRIVGRSPDRTDWDPRSLNLTRAWTALGATGVVVAAALAFDNRDLEVAGYWIAASLALLAVSSVRGATPLQSGVLRDAAGLTALGSLITFLYTAGWSDVSVTATLLVLAAVSTLLSLWVWRRRSESPWIRPLIVIGSAANVIAAALAIGRMPDKTLLIGVLMSIGVQVIAVGLTRALPGVLAIGPPVLAVAFILSVIESVSGSAQWYTAPLGLVLLAEVEIFRSLPRFADPDDDPSLIILLEWAGLGILAAPPLVEMFTVSLFVGLAAIVVSIAVFIWGVATKVRRRVIAAAGLATATLVLALFAAAAGSAPESAFFWIVAVGIGFAVMLVAGLVEAYRSKKGKTMVHLDQLMEGWK